MTTRDIGDINTNPGGKSGADWTSDARESLLALWDIHGGLLKNVSGINVLTADVAVPEGFTSYSDGLRCSFVAPATVTGAATMNIGGIGAKAIRDPDGDVLGPASIVSGRVTEIVFVAEEDAFRLTTSGGTVNVTVEGGIIVQRSAASRLVSSVGPATSLSSIIQQTFQCLYDSSRVIVEGNIGRVVGAGAADDDGVAVALYVDGESVATFTDYLQPSSHVNRPFYFSHSPGDISSHTYEIRASSTISATYTKGASVIWCSEMSPNS